MEDIEFSALLIAADKCARGVRWKSSVQMYEINKLRWLANAKRDLMKNKYRSKGFNTFTIHERGKLRVIQSVHISERVVQKMLCDEYLKPMVLPHLIYDNSASIKGKGTEFALRRLKCHLERHLRKHGTKGGILVMDFKNYFGSIDHKKLLEVMSRYITSEFAMKLLTDFIHEFKGNKGIGLGSEVCQICAVAFPNELDHFIKEKLKIKGYGRYMDDSYLIHEDIEHLKYCLTEIEKICGNLGIVINKKRTKVIPLDSGFTYLKKRFKICEANGGYKIIMRVTRKNITRQRKKLYKQRGKLDSGKLTFDSVCSSYFAWRSYIKKCNNYKTRINMDNLFCELFREEIENGCGSSKGIQKTARKLQRKSTKHG